MSTEAKHLKESIDAAVEAMSAASARYDTLDAQHKAQGEQIKELLNRFEQHSPQVQKALAELVTTQERMNQVSAELKKLEAQIKGVQDGIADWERERAAPKGKRGEVKTISMAEKIVASPDWKELRNTITTRTRGKMRASFKGCFLGGLEIKASENITSDESDALVVEADDLELIRAPSRTPIHRLISDVRRLARTDKILLRKVSKKMRCVATITATANSGDSAVTVNRVAGFSDDTSFNEVTIERGTTVVATKNIQSIAATSATDPKGPGTITFSATIGAAVQVNDLLFAEKFILTDDVELRPRGQFTLATEQVATKPMGEVVTVANDELRFTENLESVIEEELREAIALNEEFHYWQGPSGQTDHHTGIINDSDISTVTWSSQASGTTIIDLVWIGMVTVEQAHYMPTTLVLHPVDWRKMMTSKGTDGQYIFYTATLTGGEMRIMGLQVFKTTGLPSGKGVLGDFRRAVRIYDAMEFDLAFGTNDDDFERDQTSIRGIINSAIFVAHPDALVILHWDSQP